MGSATAAFKGLVACMQPSGHQVLILCAWQLQVAKGIGPDAALIAEASAMSVRLKISIEIDIALGPHAHDQGCSCSAAASTHSLSLQALTEDTCRG